MLDVKALLAKILQRLNNIGQIKQHTPSAVSCSNTYYRQLAYITLEEGVWLISGVATFPYNNTTGVRRVFVSTATSAYDNVTTQPPAWGNILYEQEPITGSYQPFVHVGTAPINVPSTTTFRLIGWQNSGATVSVTGRIYAVRVA